MRTFPWAYVLIRLGRFVLTVWLGATLIFIIPRLGSSSPTDAILGRLAESGAGVDNAQVLIDSYKKRFGLDQSIWSQYLHYLQNVFTFNRRLLALVLSSRTSTRSSGPRCPGRLA